MQSLLSLQQNSAIMKCILSLYIFIYKKFSCSFCLKDAILICFAAIVLLLLLDIMFLLQNPTIHYCFYKFSLISFVISSSFALISPTVFHSPPSCYVIFSRQPLLAFKKKINILNQVKAGATQLRGTKQSQHQLNNRARSLVA